MIYHSYKGGLLSFWEGSKITLMYHVSIIGQQNETSHLMIPGESLCLFTAQTRTRCEVIQFSKRKWALVFELKFQVLIRTPLRQMFSNPESNAQNLT